MFWGDAIRYSMSPLGKAGTNESSEKPVAKRRARVVVVWLPLRRVLLVTLHRSNLRGSTVQSKAVRTHSNTWPQLIHHGLTDADNKVEVLCCFVTDEEVRLLLSLDVVD